MRNIGESIGRIECRREVLQVMSRVKLALSVLVFILVLLPAP
jgi:hypothetical protein